MRNIFFILFGIVLLLASCGQGNKGERFLPSSTGAVNSIIIVMDDDLWKGTIGDSIREVFAQPALGLSPIQPMFTLNQIPPLVFKGAVRHSRAILFVEQDSLSVSHLKSDVYASPQTVAVVKGKNYEALLSNIDSIAQKAIGAFKQTEMEEAQRRFTRSLNKEGVFEERFGIKMSIPSAYHVGSNKENFVWIDRQIPKGTMNIIGYSMPMNSLMVDSTFVRDIVHMRDSIGKKYIPGPYKETYMVTEKAFAPYVFPTEIGGKKAVEVKGIWEMQGYPMAGPFQTYIINDKEHQRRLVLEGFVFAPSTQKRDYMFELEAILKTVKWVD